jgi:hypothetical protein
METNLNRHVPSLNLDQINRKGIQTGGVPAAVLPSESDRTSTVTEQI